MSILLYKNIDITKKIGLDELRKDSINGKNIQFIFPTGRLKRYFNNYYLREFFNITGKPLLKEPGITLDSFVKSTYFKLFEEKRRLISEDYTFGLIETVINKSKLKYYNYDNVPIEIVDTLSSIIWGFIKEGLTVESLRSSNDTILNINH